MNVGKHRFETFANIECIIPFYLFFYLPIKSSNLNEVVIVFEGKIL